MAQRTHVIISDDIDGTEEGVEPVTFGYAGVVYEIDLSKENRDAFDLAIAIFVRRARVVRPTRPAARSPRKGENPEAAKIREWALAHGLSVAPRGRIPAEVLKAYRERAVGQVA